ncbi:sugar phosphate isomerase/epimerase [bacterium AH-315-I18]|nr:sugar phosphate isomerase/epimerase [bacterium AH-315-I18]
MKIGCGEWGFRKLPLQEHFEIAKKLGFSIMEIGIGGGQVGRLPDQMSQKQINTFRRLRNNYDITTPFCCIENDFTLPCPDSHIVMLEKTLTQIKYASELDATHVRLFAGFTPANQMNEAIWSRLLNAFNQCADRCDQLGLTIAVETHGQITQASDGSAMHTHTVSTDRISLQRLLDELPTQIGFNYDPGNIKAVNPDDHRYCLDLLDARINYCHLKDWRRTDKGWAAVAPGDDDLDYATLLSKMSFDGVYLIEYEPTEDVLDGIRRSLTYLQHINLVLEMSHGVGQ